MNSATIKDLKPFVEKKVNEMEQSKMSHEAITIFSWINAVWQNLSLIPQ
ncbi:putative SNRNP25, ubiquitin-like domain-containing protein [Helianthus annuus]|nr:putative SNRNP25, ubiquitin-like domain-containing protein [Helianthus annuus]